MITIHCDDVSTLSHMYTHTHTPTHTQGDPSIDGDDGTPGNPGRMVECYIVICLAFSKQTYSTHQTDFPNVFLNVFPSVFLWYSYTANWKFFYILSSLRWFLTASEE